MCTIFIGVDLAQTIGDIDFENFCLMYTVDGVINLLNQGMRGAGSPMGAINKSSSSSGIFIKNGKDNLVIKYVGNIQYVTSNYIEF